MRLAGLEADVTQLRLTSKATLALLSDSKLSYERALAELQSAVQAGQGGADAYLRLADLYRVRGQLKKAIRSSQHFSVSRWPGDSKMLSSP